MRKKMNPVSSSNEREKGKTMLKDRLKNSYMPYGQVPGVFLEGETYLFCTVIRQGEKCRLLLFKKGDKTPAKKVAMKRLENTNVFYTRLSIKEAGYENYLYEDAKGTYVDAYAGRVTGRERFGSCGETAALLPKPEKKRGRRSTFCPPAFSDLLFYKLHVRGFTKSPTSGVKGKGTFAGMKEKIPYLKELGINAVLFMPVYEFEECMEQPQEYARLPKETLREYGRRYGSEFLKAQMEYDTKKEKPQTAGKVNYWGYAAENFYFAPKASFASVPAEADAELKDLVDALHAEKIAVFFEMFFQKDVCPFLVLDCLRYWTEQYHADGFRLIGDGLPMELLLKDAYLAGVKFLLSDGGMAKEDGRYDHRRIAIYNDGFRNVARKFIKGDENMTGEFIGRLCTDAPDAARIHYIADQNGFSLYDLYAYDRKHNERNGEDNKDGEDYNYSWNCGVEGETNKKKIIQLRTRLRKNALCTVLLSQSVPLLFAGDEFGHSKKGNNNAYCQDNEVSWLNWRLKKETRELFEFAKALIAFRKAHPVLCGGRQLRTEDYKGLGLPEVSYHGVGQWRPDFAPYSRCIAVLFNGEYVKGENREDVYLIFNMHWENHVFALPEKRNSKDAGKWEIALDTSELAKIRPEEDLRAYAVTADKSLEKPVCEVPSRSVVVLVRKLPQEVLRQ